MGLLAEPQRLRVVSALALGAGTIAEVAGATGLDQREVVAALRRLERGGLVSREKDQVTLRADRFKEVAREVAPAERTGPLSADPATDRVLRAYTRDGRITGLPAQRTKRRLLLEHVAAMFEPGVRYPEREVDAMMRAWHADHAMLRRYLVDAALLAREGGFYWRIGGPVALDEAPPQPVPPEPPEPRQRSVRVGAYGLAERDGEVLLTRLCRGTHAGRWTLPGGGLDFGERPLDGLAREVREETGLEVRVDGLLDVDGYRYTDRGHERHWVPIVYRITVVSGTLGVTEVGGSTDRAAWWARGALGPDELSPFAWRLLTTGRLSG